MKKKITSDELFVDVLAVSLILVLVVSVFDALDSFWNSWPSK